MRYRASNLSKTLSNTGTDKVNVILRSFLAATEIISSTDFSMFV
jgi:hypothetical protein